MNYRKWLIEELQNLERERFAIGQLTEELETVSSEMAAIKATSYDKMPTGSGENKQEEKLLTAVAKKAELSANLDATRRHVADMDRLIAALPDDERRIIDRMYVHRERNAAEELADELGYETSHIYRLKNAALQHLCQLRYGVGYRP